MVLLSFRGPLIAAVVALVACTVSVVHGCTSPSPSQLKTCGNNNSNSDNNNNLLFGIRSESKKVASASSIVLINGISRGGELHEPSTLKEVNDLVTRAGIQNKLVVIDFTASWCGPCQQIAPVYKQMSDEFGNEEVVFLKVDVDECPDAAAKYSVKAMPTFILVKGGQVAKTILGANIPELKTSIDIHK